ncbi:hypothetical protein DK427_07285 [Methylobacterium radiodurans]|uniref:Uncharacterized protein n=1 Tax=Methylobacterium radiodurans TaxID=2202828 RepID=A0A2U8VQE8_9HYPH|nr:hypothetical protein DK427_07285 [Methylobacterium radiodurans]
MNGERLAEVSRLAGALADEVMSEHESGEASMAKLTALGRAALLLQDYDRPIPDRVVDVLSRALRGEEDGAIGHAEGDAGQDGAMREAGPETMRAMNEPEVPRRLFPRLIQSLRPPRG